MRHSQHLSRNLDLPLLRVSLSCMTLHCQLLMVLVYRRTTAARGQPVTNSEVVLDVEEHAAP